MQPKPIVTRLKPELFTDFLRRLESQLDFNGCQHGHAATFEVLNAMGADIEGTIQYLKSKGGYCDCEVMFNVVLGDFDPITD